MHAILIVFDEPEIHSVTIHPPWLIEKFFDLTCELLPEKIANAICGNLPSFCYPRNEDKICMHVRNGAVQKVKKLLSYLRKHRKLPKSDISFLRSSRFSSSADMLAALSNLIKSRMDDDILLFCAAHGGIYQRWFLGENKNGRKYIYYSDLQKLLDQFRGRLIIVNEVCRALNLNPHLSKLKGRYLIIGTSLENHSGSGLHSVVDNLCRYWQKRQVAEVRVGEMWKADYGEWMDIPSGNSRVTRFPDNPFCPCYDKIVKTKVFQKNDGPLLRIGAELDYLMYPPQ